MRQLLVWLLVGRNDRPTDGVRDYCRELARACGASGVSVRVVDVPWYSHGWLRALHGLRRELGKHRPDWVVVQVTHLAWSRRGFSAGMILPAIASRAAGVRVAAMIHDPSGFGGSRVVDRARRAAQHASMKLLTLLTDPLFVSVDPAVVPWLDRHRDRVQRLVVGSNVGENPGGPQEGERHGPFRVAVFGVAEGPRGAEERRLVVEVARMAAKRLGQVTVVAFGRGTGPEAGPWPKASGVEVEMHGLVPCEEASQLLSGAGALLHVRGPVSTRRGTVAAAIAHGLPIVGYGGAETAPPVTEAGVMLVEPDDVDGLASALIRLGADDDFACEFRRRSREAWREHFSWERIAARFLDGLGLHSTGQHVRSA